MGYELLFKVGDDPLAELAELDRFYQWSVRIRKVQRLFEKKSSVNRWLVAAMIVLVAAASGLIGAVVYLYLS